jgi:hypothetical protein
MMDFFATGREADPPLSPYPKSGTHQTTSSKSEEEKRKSEMQTGQLKEDADPSPFWAIFG